MAKATYKRSLFGTYRFRGIEFVMQNGGSRHHVSGATAESAHLKPQDAGREHAENGTNLLTL